MSVTEICSICLEAPKICAITDACDHLFCYSCLFDWCCSPVSCRRCPLCRRNIYKVASAIPGVNQPKGNKKKSSYLNAVTNLLEDNKYIHQYLENICRTEDSEQLVEPVSISIDLVPPFHPFVFVPAYFSSNYLYYLVANKVLLLTQSNGRYPTSEEVVVTVQLACLSRRHYMPTYRILSMLKQVVSLRTGVERVLRKSVNRRVK